MNERGRYGECFRCGSPADTVLVTAGELLPLCDDCDPDSNTSFLRRRKKRQVLGLLVAVVGILAGVLIAAYLQSLPNPFTGDTP